MQSDFKRCLEEIDVIGIRKLWSHVSPHLPQPTTDHDALVCIHSARTQTKSITTRLRFYSHRWLLDRGYPSALSDELKPSAERMYPRVVEGVGISVNSKNPIMKPINRIVRGAMSDAVEDAYADKKTDPVFVRARMFEARDKTVKQLIGRLA